MRHLPALLLFLCLLASCAEQNRLPYYNDPSFEPEWLAESGRKAEDMHQIAPFSFTNQEGEELSQSDTDGHIYVASFFFTVCPSICPTMTGNLLRVQEYIADDAEILLLSHSVTPEIDSVARLKAYALDKGVVSGKWHLLTGDQEEIYRLARQSYFAEEEIGLQKGTDDFLHTENFMLIDKQRHIRGVYNGTLATDMERLIRDIEDLKAAG